MPRNVSRFRPEITKTVSLDVGPDFFKQTITALFNNSPKEIVNLITSACQRYKDDPGFIIKLLRKWRDSIEFSHIFLLLFHDVVEVAQASVRLFSILVKEKSLNYREIELLISILGVRFCFVPQMEKTGAESFRLFQIALDSGSDSLIKGLISILTGSLVSNRLTGVIPEVLGSHLVAFEFLCEMIVLNPLICHSDPTIISTLIDSLMFSAPGVEAIWGIVNSIIIANDYSNIHRNCPSKCSLVIDCSKLFFPFTDLNYWPHFGLKEGSGRSDVERLRKETRENCAAAIGFLLRSWSGVAMVFSGRSMESLTQALYLSEDEVCLMILRIFYNSLNIPFKKMSNDSTSNRGEAFKDAILNLKYDEYTYNDPLEEMLSRLSPAFAAHRPDLIKCFHSVLLCFLLEAGIVENLSRVILNTKNDRNRLLATVLLSHIFHIGSQILPSDHSNLLSQDALVQASNTGDSERSSFASEALSRVSSSVLLFKSLENLPLQSRVCGHFAKQCLRLVQEFFEQASKKRSSQDISSVKSRRKNEHYLADWVLDGIWSLSIAQIGDGRSTKGKKLRRDYAATYQMKSEWDFGKIADILEKIYQIILQESRNPASTPDSARKRDSKLSNGFFNFFNANPEVYVFFKAVLQFFNPEKKKLVRIAGLEAVARCIRPLAEILILGGFEGDLLEFLSGFVPWLSDLTEFSTVSGGECYYFLFLGIFSKFNDMDSVLNRVGVVEELERIVRVNGAIAPFILSSLSLPRLRPEHVQAVGTNVPKAVFYAAVASKSVQTRIAVCKLALVAVRAGLGHVLGSFILGDTVLQRLLLDTSSQVRSSALSVLEEMFENNTLAQRFTDSNVYGNLPLLGLRGRLLFSRLLSIPQVFRWYYSRNPGFIEFFLDSWCRCGFDGEYSRLLDEGLSSALNFSIFSSRGFYLRRQSSDFDRENTCLKPSFFPPQGHLLDCLSQHKEGLELLQKSRFLNEICESVEHFAGVLTGFEGERGEVARILSDPKAVVKLKSDLWAIGHLGNSEWAIDWLVRATNAVPALVVVAKTCPNYSIRGVAFYCICLIGSLGKGGDVLGEFGWHVARQQHGHPWPIMEKERSPFFADTTVIDRDRNRSSGTGSMSFSSDKRNSTGSTFVEQRRGTSSSEGLMKRSYTGNSSGVFGLDSLDERETHEKSERSRPIFGLDDEPLHRNSSFGGESLLESRFEDDEKERGRSSSRQLERLDSEALIWIERQRGTRPEIVRSQPKTLIHSFSIDLTFSPISQASNSILKSPQASPAYMSIDLVDTCKWIVGIVLPPNISILIRGSRGFWAQIRENVPQQRSNLSGLEKHDPESCLACLNGVSIDSFESTVKPEQLVEFRQRVLSCLLRLAGVYGLPSKMSVQGLRSLRASPFGKLVFSHDYCLYFEILGHLGSWHFSTENRVLIGQLLSGFDWTGFISNIGHRVKDGGRDVEEVLNYLDNAVADRTEHGVVSAPLPLEL